MASKYIRNTSLIASKIDDELVMMDTDQGNYFGLNPVGAHIWNLLETAHSEADILASVQAAFAAPEASILQKDVSSFIELMTQNGLVKDADE